MGMSVELLRGCVSSTTLRYTPERVGGQDGSAPGRDALESVTSSGGGGSAGFAAGLALVVLARDGIA